MLLGVDTIPDTFRTMANVTGWLGAGSILARFSPVTRLDSSAGTLLKYEPHENRPTAW